MTRSRRANLIAIAILALVPTILFADVLFGGASLFVRDISRFHYPTKKILREIVLGGHFPYWNPYVSAGQPLAANPQHEVFYPPTWLILLPDFHRGFHLLVLLHVYLAEFGMYALLRSIPVRRPVACFAACAFGAGGLMLSALNLFPFLFSIAWLPLVCLFTRRFLLRKSRRDFALAALCLGMQLLIGEPTTALQTGIILGLYALFERGRRTLWIGAIGLAALLIAAVQVVPAADHFRDSVRGRGLSFEAIAQWSFPPIRLGELFFPHIAGHDPLMRRESPFYASIYGGLALAVLALTGVIARVRGWKLFLTAMLVSIVLALGRNTPLLQLLYDAGLKSTRYFEKFILTAVFAVLVFGAVALDRLLRGDERVRKAAMAVTLATIAVAIAAAFGADARKDWLVAAARGAFLLIVLRNVAAVRRTWWVALVGVFTLLDLATLVPEVAPRVERSYYLSPPQAARALPRNRDDYRIFHLAERIANSDAGRKFFGPGDDLYWLLRNGLVPAFPATYGIRTAIDIDYDKTALLPAADLAESVSELSRANPRRWVGAIAAMSNVWFVGVYRDPHAEAVRTGGDKRQMQPVEFVETGHAPRYYFATELVPIADRHDFVRKLASGRYDLQAAFIRKSAFQPAQGIVRKWREWPNGAQLEVEAAGRAFLVMSVTPHKYWRIAVDGRETPAISTNIGYQGVPVPPGRHTVTMTYRNPLIPAAGAVSLLAVLACLASVLSSRASHAPAREKSHRRPPRL